MTLSRTHLVKILSNCQLKRIICSCRCISHESGGDGKSGVDVSEISALKDFVDDSIIRGSSLLPAGPCNSNADHTDIHQLHYLCHADLQNKELHQVLHLYDESTDVEDFLNRYRSSPTFSVAGFIAAPVQLYYKAAEIRRLANIGLKPLDSLRALRYCQEQTVRKRMAVLKELGEDAFKAGNVVGNRYRAVVSRSLYHAKKNKLIGDKDVVQVLVDQLPLSECIKSKLVKMSHAAFGMRLDAMSATDVKISVINEYLSMTMPQVKFNPVTEGEFGKLWYFRLSNAVQVVDVIRNDAECMKNISQIHFGSLSRRLSPDDLKRLLLELPQIGVKHISAVFFHKCMVRVFHHGVDNFIQRYKFLKEEGFSDQEIVKGAAVLRLSDKTRDERLGYWYKEVGKNNVVLSNRGVELLEHHKRVVYKHEVINGKKAVPVYFLLLRSGKSNRRNDVITEYIHEFCNKYSFDAKTFIDGTYSSTHFETQNFDLVNFYDVYNYLVEQRVCKEQLANSPYVLVTDLAAVKREFEKLASDGLLEKWIRHPRLLDMVVYLCHTDGSKERSCQVLRSEVVHKLSTTRVDTSLAATTAAITSENTKFSPKSGSEFVVHDRAADDSMLYDGNSPLLPLIQERNFI